MSTTAAKPSFRTLLQMADANGANFATIAEVMDISWGITAKTEDTTSHSNTVPWTTIITTLMTMGPVEFTVNFVPNDATHNATTGLTYVVQNRTERQFKIIDPDSLETYTFAAVITSLKRTATVAGVKKGTISMMGSGQPTLS